MVVKIKQAFPPPSPRLKNAIFFYKESGFIKRLSLVKSGLKQLTYFFLTDLTVICPNWSLKPVLHLSESPFCTEPEKPSQLEEAVHRGIKL